MGLSNSVSFTRSPGQQSLDTTDGSPEKIFFIVLSEGDQGFDGATICLTSIEMSDGKSPILSRTACCSVQLNNSMGVEYVVLLVVYSKRARSFALYSEWRPQRADLSRTGVRDL